MTVDQWRPFARRYLKRLSHQLDYEDIVQEAVINLWRADNLYRDLPTEHRERIFKSVVWKSAQQYLRSPRNVGRRYDRQGTPTLSVVSWDETETERELKATVPDFAPALIERLRLEEILATVQVPSRWRAVFERMILADETAEQVAPVVGTSPGGAQQIAWKLRRKLREAAGMSPPKRWRGVILQRSGRWAARLSLGPGKGRVYYGTWPTSEAAAIVIDAAVVALGLPGSLNLLPDSVRTGVERGSHAA